MRAEIAASPELVSLPREPQPERLARGVELETALIGAILWRRRKIIGLAAALCGVAALAYCVFTTPQYTATAQILVDPRDKQVVRDDVNPSAIAADGGVTQVESQGSVLQSNGVLLRAIAATHLETDSEFNGSGLFAALSRLAEMTFRTTDANAIAERLKAETVQTLRKHVTVKRAEKVLVLDLAVRAKTAERAAELANAVAAAYLADQADARAASGRDASKALSSRLGDLQQNLRQAETAVADYRASHDFVVSAGALVSDQELNQTTAQLTAAQNRVASLRAQLDQLRSRPNTEGTPEAMASATMTRLRDRESGVVEKLASAQRQLGPLHPDLASLQQSLSEVRGLIAREAQRLRQAAEADYVRAREDRDALAKSLDAMKTKSLDDGKDDVRLRVLQQQAEAARSIYQAFLTRARETMEASNVDTTNARVITEALPPLQKSWPPTLLLVLGAAFLGASLGASGALAQEYARPTLLSPAQASEAAGAPVIGILAARDLATSPNQLARAILRKLDDRDANAVPVIGACVFLASTAAAAPARRRLIERIAAHAATQEGETLLIDGDLAGAGSAAGAAPGFVDVLRGEGAVAELAALDEALGFARLGSGVGDPDEAPARGGGDLFRLRRLRRAYDLVALDGGRLSENPRIAALGQEASLVVLVAALGEPQSALMREAESAAAAGARVDAVALIDLTAA